MPTFDDYRNIDIDIDGANDWIPEIRLSGGDVEGRTITVRLLKDGKVIDDPTESGSVTLTARLLFNPKVGTAYPGGYKTMSKFVSASPTGEHTWGFRVTVPRAAFTNLTGSHTAMAIEVQKTTSVGSAAKDEIVCSRTFNAIVDESVLKAGDGTDPDPLEEWHNLINNGDGKIQDMVDRGNSAIATFNTNGQNAIDGVNKVKNDMQSLVDGANIAAGTVTERKPNEAPTFELTGDKWNKTMNLGLPRGASIASITATTLQAGQQATVTSNKNADGDYNVEVGLPTGPQGVDGFPVFVFTSAISSTSTDYSIAKNSGNISPRPDIDTNYTNKAFIMDADGSVFLVFSDDSEGLHVNGSQRLLSLKGPAGEGVLIDSTKGLVSSAAGVAINLSADNPGLEFDAAGGLKATAQTVGDGSHTSKGILQVGDGLNVDNGVVSLETATSVTLGGVIYDDKTIQMGDDSKLFAAIGCVSKVQAAGNTYYNIAPRPICFNSDSYVDQAGVWFGFYVSAREISFNEIFLTLRMANGVRFPSSNLSSMASYLTSRRIAVDNATLVGISSATSDYAWGTIDLTLETSLTINEGPHWFEVSEFDA